MAQDKQNYYLIPLSMVIITCERRDNIKTIPSHVLAISYLHSIELHVILPSYVSRPTSQQIFCKRPNYRIEITLGAAGDKRLIVKWY